MSKKEQAEKWFEEAIDATKKVKYRDAIEVLQKAAPIFQQEMDWVNYVACLSQWCECLGRSGQIEATVEKGLEALSFSQSKLGKFSQTTARCLNNLGIAYKAMGNYKKAFDCYHQSLEITLQLKNVSWLIANTYNNLGIVCSDIGNLNESIEYYEKSLEINIDLFGESNPSTAGNFNNLGSIYKSKGDFEKAIQYYEKSLKIKLQILGEMHPSTANSINNLGIVFWSKSDYDKSIELYNRSLYIRLKTLGKSHPDTATTLNTLGVVYHSKENFDKAIDYYHQSLAVRLSVLGKNHQDIGDSYNNLGAVYLEKKEYDKAVNYHEKSLAIRLQTVGEKHIGTAKNFNNIGAVYAAKGDFDKAIRFLKKGLHIYLEILGEKHPITARCYLKLAEVLVSKRQFKEALQYQQYSLSSLYQHFTPKTAYTNPSLSNCLSFSTLLNILKAKAKTLQDLYLYQTHKLKDLLAAHFTYRLATQLITQIRHSFQSEGSKLTLAQKATEVYDQAIEVALAVESEYKKENRIKEIQTTHQELQTLNPEHILPKLQNTKPLAFTYAEQSKSIILLSSIKDTEAKSTSHISKDLLQQEYDLQIELNYLNKRIKEEQSKGKKAHQKQILEWQNQHYHYKQEYNQLIEKFEADYPEYFRLKHEVKTVSIEDLQKDLKPNTAMISYYLSPTQLYIFTLTSTTYEVHQTQDFNDSNQLLEDFLFYIESLDHSMYIQTAHQLYQFLLKPALKHLQNNTQTSEPNQLIIIPHGKLLYLPFEALLTSTVSPNTPYSKLPYLIQKYAISYHYSATLFHHSLQNNSQKQPKTSKSFIGFAPIYADATAQQDSAKLPNPSIIESTTKEEPQPENAFWDEMQIAPKSPKPYALPLRQYQAETMRSVTFNGKKYGELIYSEKEVKQVAQIFKKQQYKTQTSFHAEATKEQFFKQVREYQYILISAHGIRNDRQPQLSGIIFSPNEDVDFHEEIMYLSDAYTLQLNADLVVLSCCESGIGELAKGEGMMAMNRGFLYAGAKNIVFTLFKVYDKASSELTQVLFEGILAHSLSYPKALQQAKLQLIQRKGFTPKAWAGYVLIGM